jgi:NADH-quinone oxidoreductase subunit N
MDSVILKSFIPEIFFSLCILIQLLFNARLINNWNLNFPIIDKEAFIQTFFILVCVFFLLLNVKVEGFFNNLLLVNDEGSNLIKIFLILSSIFSLTIIFKGISFQTLNFFEFLSIFLLSIFSLLLLISSYDFISAYLVIEMQALCFYILASFKRNSAFSTEAGLKYFISGSFISGLFLFGCSLIYGALGTLNFNNINLLLSFSLINQFDNLYFMVLIGILFIFITLLFKIAAVPFHFWSPDVYEGAPLSSTIIFTILPKIVIFHFLIKCINTFALISYDFQILFLISGFLSVFVGTFFAIRQKRFKRFIIYSSIAQVGFLVSALSTKSIDGFTSIFFFLFIYIISSILIWSYVIEFNSSFFYINRFEKKLLTPIYLSNFSSYFKINKIGSFSLLLIFFSIAGIPPLSGFLSKIFILSSLIDSKFLIISVIITIISAVSAFYYLRIIKLVFFENKNLKINNKGFHTLFVSFFNDIHFSIISLLLYLLIFFFFFPELLYLSAHFIVLSTFGF